MVGFCPELCNSIGWAIPGVYKRDIYGPFGLRESMLGFGMMGVLVTSLALHLEVQGLKWF